MRRVSGAAKLVPAVTSQESRRSAMLQPSAPIVSKLPASGAAPVRGITVTLFTGENSTTDFTPQLLELRRANPKPDLIVAAYTGSALLMLLKQAADLSLAPSAETAIFGRILCA